MAKPRVFVSSTYYDLKHVRRHVESFIKQMGYESILFENGDIPFHHDQPLDESCYAEIDSCHILILIIGGKYGSIASADNVAIGSEQINKVYDYYNSITKKEYLKARDKRIPIFIFVEKGVYAEYETFKKNRLNESITYAHVDSKNIFKLLDEIISQRTNNFVRGFENFDDITNWLKEQWAGLFADFLSKKTTDIKLKNLEDQIEELKGISNTLMVYNEAIVRSSNVKDGSEIIKQEELKLRNKKAIRFKSEPMIEFFTRTEKITLPTNTLFDSFETTKTLEEFLAKININKTRIYGLNRRAYEEYKMLRNRYLDENNIVDFAEVNGEVEIKTDSGDD